jgi:hypothetical protein
MLLDKNCRVQIDLTVEWSKMFQPGQLISMHMVGWINMEPALCPECETLCVALNERGHHW